MTLLDKIIYLADYIDMSRKFEDCVHLRECFWGACPEKMSETERLLHLDKTLVLSFDMTIRGLLESGSVISTETAEARNDLLRRLKK
jgi:HD superfamily phosphohydrolase YqeK